MLLLLIYDKDFILTNKAERNHQSTSV